jgi:phosphotransferase system HPr (HPr) family protein
MAIERQAEVRNREGLHFRPIMRIVDLVARFEAEIKVANGDRVANIRSPLELLMLTATQGTQLRLIADGADAEQALAALVELIENGLVEE